MSLSVGAAPLFFGQAVLTQSPPPGAEVVHLGTLEFMTAVLFDFGVFLLVLGFAVGVVSFFARTIAAEEEYAGPEGAPKGDEGR